MARINRKVRVRPRDHITRPQILELLLGPNGEGVSAFADSAERQGLLVEAVFAEAWDQVEKKLSPGFATQWYAASRERKPFTEIAEKYARDVLAERIPACKWTQLACKRHLKDLERAAAGWKYRFDAAKAGRICRFIELLPHVKGIWAANAQRLKLEPWQVFNICCLFGWVKVSNGLRRFTLAYLEVARKNAKSIIAAAIGLYMFCCDGEFGAEVYSGATTEDQAHEVYRPAWYMMERSPELAYVLGVIPAAKGLKTAEDKSRFEPVVGKPGDGASPYLAIVDEYHEHDSDSLFDAMQTGMGARTQPLVLVITTAGDNMAGPCKLMHDDICKILEGIERDEVFGIIYTVDDPKHEWATEIGLRKANPNYGVSVFQEYLDTQQRGALANPRKRGVFQTKNCCVWVGAVAGYFDVMKWAQLGNPLLKTEDFQGSPCCVSIDLSTRKDFTARALMFKKVQAGKDHYYLFMRFYLPQAEVEKPEGQTYQEWVANGHLVKHDGATVNFQDICDEAVDTIKKYKAAEFPYDDWNAEMFAQQVKERTRAETWNVDQRAKQLSLPTKELDILISEGRIHHDANPVMTWMIGNVVAKEDKNENVFPHKEEGRAEKKIDGAVAAIMTLSRLMLTTRKQSVYARRGILTIPQMGGGLMAARV